MNSFEQVPVVTAYLRIAPDLSLEACGGDCREVLGYESSDLRTSLEDVLHPTDRPALEQLVVAAAHGAPDPTPERPEQYTHLRLRDASGVYRVLIATVTQDSDAGNAGSSEATHKQSVTLTVRDARLEPSAIGEVISPLMTTIMESTDDFIFFKSQHHILLAASQSMVSLCEPINHWREFSQKSDYDIFPEELADKYYDLEVRVYAGEDIAKEIQPMLHTDGTPGWVDNRKYPIRSKDGAIIGLYGIARDITPQIEAVVSKELSASVFDNSSESILILDAEGRIVNVNHALCDATGRTAKDLHGRTLREVKHSDESDESYAQMWARLREGGQWQGELSQRSAQGVRNELGRLSAVRDDQGEVHHYIGLYADITELKQHERQLERIAHFDSLTGLPNRELLADRLQQGIADCIRRRNHLAVAFLDLDGFKQINDRNNHHVGDQFLQGITRSLKSALRDTDTLSRLGGDEFVAVITDLSLENDFEPVVERLLEAAMEPVHLAASRKSLHATASIGVTVYPRDGTDPDMLLRRADQAMYVAKQRGKNQAFVYESGNALNDATREDLEHAVLGNELELHYQPKVNLSSGELEGVEALVRWQHPERGLISPAQFLPLVERENLSIELGEWVLAAAVRQSDAWNHEGLSLPISLNISGVHLLHANFVPKLEQLLESAEVRPILEIEVLETSALHDSEAVAKVIERCRPLGVQFSLDDFGTGFSSLTHLRQLPVTSVKIDCSFVHGMLEDPEDLSIVSSIVGLCSGLGRRVIAEGVCSAQHAHELLSLGCQHGQGFAIARPMPAQDLLRWHEEWQAHQPWRFFGAAHAAVDPDNARQSGGGESDQESTSDYRPSL